MKLLAPKNIAILVLLFMAGLTVPYINWAGAEDVPLTNTDPKTKAGAEVAALRNPPAFAIDPITLLPKNNTSAICQPGEGNFVCVVTFEGQTATAFVAADGTVIYR